MKRAVSTANWIFLAVLWLAMTGGVAFLVARQAAPTPEDEDPTQLLSPIGIQDRVTVTLSEQLIAPVLSADATVVNYDGTFMLEAPAMSDDLTYRLLDPPVMVRARINGGPSGFECEWAGLGQSRAAFSVPMGTEPAQENESETGSSTSPGAPMSPTSGVTMRCEIPEDVRVAAGMSGLMVIQLDEPVETSSLPVSAVVGEANSGQVVIVHEDGTIEVRSVTLGVSDIYNIQIIDGLEPTDSVLQNPTQSDFNQLEGGS